MATTRKQDGDQGTDGTRPSSLFLNQYLRQPPHPISVTVIGAGATGSDLCRELARVNHLLILIGHPGIFLTLVDNDVIEAPNVGKSFFNPSMIGMSKAEVVIENINRFYGFNWRFFNAMADPYHMFESLFENSMTNRKTVELDNFFISCVDSNTFRNKMAVITKAVFNNEVKLINEANASIPYYWMDVANELDYGQIILSKITQFKDEWWLDNIVDIYGELEQKVNTDSCSIFDSLSKQDLFINGFMAKYAAKMFYDFITDYKLDANVKYINMKQEKVASQLIISKQEL